MTTRKLTRRRNPVKETRLHLPKESRLFVVQEGPEDHVSVAREGLEKALRNDYYLKKEQLTQIATLAERSVSLDPKDRTTDFFKVSEQLRELVSRIISPEEDYPDDETIDATMELVELVFNETLADMVNKRRSELKLRRSPTDTEKIV